jgi:hypothetical protein
MALPPELLVVHQSPLVHREIAAKFGNSLTVVRAPPAAKPATARTVEEKLEALTEVDFDRVPLPAALDSLAKRHAVKIAIDESALKAAEVRSDEQRVTLRLGKDLRTRKPSLASGLSLLLERVDANLTWIADDGGITITTPKAAKERLVRRTYDVSDLLPEGGMETLIHAIQSTIAPADWEEVGGAGSIRAGAARGALDVSQSCAVHRELRQLLADMRAGSAAKQ